ncbi:hypothetical protein [Marinobacter shengliensis]|uniref:hypothetical protein n=1 Tax=Marinobacter shengliensis TaxID=1389223 RepID=UPI0025732E48|nr:hypothetical protein [Marinobacter shengliensis]BEH15770.1 hypothetical protein MAALD49_31380 [Marinobacter shengliensis]
MRALFAFSVAFIFSASALAGNISDNKDMTTRYSEVVDSKSVKNILQNAEMQRLHRDMTHYAMSETGMEARLRMMSKEGRAYHNALEKKQKKAAK